MQSTIASALPSAASARISPPAFVLCAICHRLSARHAVTFVSPTSCDAVTAASRSSAGHLANVRSIAALDSASTWSAQGRTDWGTLGSFRSSVTRYAHRHAGPKRLVDRRELASELASCSAGSGRYLCVPCLTEQALGVPVRGSRVCVRAVCAR